MSQKQKSYPIYIFIIMASTTGLAILAELAPSGVLLQISQDLGVTPSHAGLLIGVYALASALLTIPLMSKFLSVNRKRLLQGILSIFILSNLVVYLAPSFPLILLCRLIGGAAAGLLWPMISAYGARLVPTEKVGGTIALIMSGGTLSLIIGIPIITEIGNRLSWRMEFLSLAILAGLISLLVSLFLPSLPGQKKEGEGDTPSRYFKDKNLQTILLMTFLTITAHYALYVFFVPLLKKIGYGGAIVQAQLIFGLASYLSLVGSIKLVDGHLYRLIFFNIVTGVLAMAIFIFIEDRDLVANIGLFLWGCGFGALSSLFQATLAKKMPWGIDMGNAIQSACFNISIMVGSSLGGMILDRGQVVGILVFCLVLFILSLGSLIWKKEVFLQGGPNEDRA